MKRFIAIFLVLASWTGLALYQGRARAQNNGNWGTIKGRIVWGGNNIPQQKPIESIKTNNDKGHCLEKGPILDEEWVINPKNKGIQWTFVWLTDSKDPMAELPIHPALKAIPQKDVVMDQPRCQFVPHALGMREGQVLVAKNSSPIQHNYKWTGDPIEGVAGNILLPAGVSFPIKKIKASRFPVQINCNIHGWMKGWVRVFNHPYYAVTDRDGAFEIKNAPAGDYNLVVWHESGGWLGGPKGKTGKAITIKAGKTTDLGQWSYK